MLSYLSKNSLIFLGHVISQQEIFLDPVKVEAFNNLSRPIKKQLRFFLGLVAYVHKFIPRFSELTAFFTYLL